MRLHFKEYGRGTPLIILHGLFGSLDNWHAASQRLAAHFRVFAIDQRNHGQSPHAQEMSYADMAADLQDFCRERAIDQAHVLGHSMGGKTAMQFALSCPVMVSKLVVVDIAPRVYPPTQAELIRALLALDLKAASSRGEMESALAGPIPNLALRRFLLKNLARKPGGEFFWKIDWQNLLGQLPRLGEAVGATQPFMKPTLFVRGGASAYLRDQDLGEIRRLFPQAELRTITDAGHWVHADAPEEFMEIVEEFLEA